jgi:hypothetical protein
MKDALETGAAMTQEKIHVWEAVGHGKAPFRLVGVISFPGSGLAEANVDAYNNALREVSQLSQAYGVTGHLGICDVCGHELMNNYVIRSKDGKTFVVGSECVLKSGDGGLVERVKLEERKRRKAKENEKRRLQWEAETPLREAKDRVCREIQDRKREIEKELSQVILAENTWFIEVLTTINGDFAASLAEDLRHKSMGDLSEKCLTICGEIYAKHIAGSRKNKTQYYDAFDEFFRRKRQSANTVQEKRTEAWEQERMLDEEYRQRCKKLEKEFIERGVIE